MCSIAFLFLGVEKNNEKEKLNLDFYTWEEIKKFFFKKKFENVILFSQPRSGSTFVSYVLSKELNYNDNFFPEEFFINRHFAYLKHFVKKHNKFFLNFINFSIENFSINPWNNFIEIGSDPMSYPYGPIMLILQLPLSFFGYIIDNYFFTVNSKNFFLSLGFKTGILLTDFFEYILYPFV